MNVFVVRGLLPWSNAYAGARYVGLIAQVVGVRCFSDPAPYAVSVFEDVFGCVNFASGDRGGDAPMFVRTTLNESRTVNLLDKFGARLGGGHCVASRPQLYRCAIL